MLSYMKCGMAGCEKVRRVGTGYCPEHEPRGEARAAIEGEAACPDGLLPDGPVCPRCGGKRAPSGIGGGTWIHVRAERVLEAAGLPEQRELTPSEQKNLRGVYDKLYRKAAAAPLPTAREASIPTIDEIGEAMADAGLWPGAWKQMCDAERDVTRQRAEGVHAMLMRRASHPISSLQRTAGDVIRQFRESGSEDWGELESAINWWAMNEFCPHFMKGDRAERRLRELAAKWREMASQPDPPTKSNSTIGQLAGVAMMAAGKRVYAKCAAELERALESA